ncbi:MAG: sulfatase-like hydrolase/transferase [Acidobacteria bacterium]|nr:sulfatase-like hydrolase/transferase [Acidobacteriota bacterium]
MTTCVGLGASATLIHAQPQRTPQSAPKKTNIVVIALDDVGFADLGCYGSEIATPSIDSIAKHGVRYTNFQTKAICSPTRAALLTGRNNQTVGMEDLPDQAKPGGSAAVDWNYSANAEMLSEVLRSAGYATFAVGKWHLTPRYQDGKPGNNSTMPLQRGFDSSYGYKMGWTDQYHPDLFDGNTPIADPYHPGY